MIQAHMIYTGIIGLVPRNYGYSVILQDAKHHKHEAFLMVEESALDPIPPDLKPLTPPANWPKKGPIALPLDHVQIEVAVNISNQWEPHANLQKFVLPLDSHPPRGAHAHGGIRYAALEPQLPANLAARSKLEYGSFSATWVHPWATWRWEDDPSTYRHLAQEVCHEFSIPDGPLTLILRPKSGDPDVLTIQPIDGKVEVLIGNVHENDVFGDPRDPPDNDPHVCMYFDLAAVPPQRRSQLIRGRKELPVEERPQRYHPHRLTRDTKDRIRRVGGANCPPAYWLKASI